ncbi:MAG TPA: hypothetical protein VFW11_03930 [Cyclobacteriaceae bacterium]|nr:hypothetical protein [Cyclobacteriaceae bacterium]
MKKKIFCFLLMSISALTSLGQDCTEATLAQKPGDWKEGAKGSTYGISATDLAREKSVVAALHAMVKSTYVPMGVSANFHGGYNSPEATAPGNSFSYSIIPLNYYCDGGIIKIAHETSTYFSIGANYFDVDIYNIAQGDRALAEGYNVMMDMPIEKDGYYYFKEKDVTLGFGIPGKRSMWLITYPGKLPFSYVSKKEFLEKRKQNLADEMNNASSGFNDVLKNNDTAKGFKETEYKNDPDKLAQYMKMDYLPTKDRYEKLLAESEKNFKPAFAKIESLLSLSATELSEPAIVKEDPNDHLSYLFTNDDDPFGKILIKPNPAYFNKKLPRSSPQFFWVYIVGDHKDPIASETMANIIKSVDFAALKNMLGK